MSTLLTDPIMFFIFLSLGCFFLFLTTAGVNLAILHSVAPESRPMAIALSIVIMHLFGDVPSPIVVGFLEQKTDSPPLTLLITCCWLVWPALLWGGASFLSVLKVRHSPLDGRTSRCMRASLHRSSVRCMGRYGAGL